MKKTTLQVFCKCGKGMAFLQTRCKGDIEQWFCKLRANGWQNVGENIYSSATSCNICHNGRENNSEKLS